MGARGTMMSIAQINKPARISVCVFVSIFFVVAMAGGVREAKAAEAGVGVYFLGFRGALAGFVPPPGTYVQSDKIFYSASSSKDQLFDFAGRIVADVKADAVLDVLTATWVPKTKFLGGHLGLSASLPVGGIERFHRFIFVFSFDLYHTQIVRPERGKRL